MSRRRRTYGECFCTAEAVRQCRWCRRWLCVRHSTLYSKPDRGCIRGCTFYGCRDGEGCRPAKRKPAP